MRNYFTRTIFISSSLVTKYLPGKWSDVLSSWTPRVTTYHLAGTSHPNHAPTSLSQLSSSCSYRHHQPAEPTYSISNSPINYHRCHRPRLHFRSSPPPPATRTQPSSLSHQSIQPLPSSSSPQLPSRRPSSRNRRSMNGSQRCWLMSTFLFTSELWGGELRGGQTEI